MPALLPDTSHASAASDAGTHARHVSRLGRRHSCQIHLSLRGLLNLSSILFINTAMLLCTSSASSSYKPRWCQPQLSANFTAHTWSAAKDIGVATSSHSKLTISTARLPCLERLPCHAVPPSRHFGKTISVCVEDETANSADSPASKNSTSQQDRLASRSLCAPSARPPTPRSASVAKHWFWHRGRLASPSLWRAHLPFVIGRYKNLDCTLPTMDSDEIGTKTATGKDRGNQTLRD